MGTFDILGLQNALKSISLDDEIPKYDEADILRNPLDLCRSYLAGLLCSLVGCEPDVAYRSIQCPNDITKGDFTVALPRLRPGEKANDWAPTLMENFPNDHILFLPPILDGVHLRVFISQDVIPHIFIPYITERASTYGSFTIQDDAPKRVLVEFSSPNIWEVFQGRHLRSSIIGACLSNVFENAGWNVTRVNHLSDWGKNVALLKVGWDKFGNEDAYQADPVSHLLSVYRQIEENFKPEVAASKLARDEAVKNGEDASEVQAEIENQGIYAERNAASKWLEDGSDEALAFWKRIREASITAYDELYAQLGITFDEYTGESQVSTASMERVEGLLKEKGICEESAGASVIHMQDHGLRAGTAMLRDRTHAPMYLLRDLTTMIERAENYKFDRMIIVAGNNNNSHFTQLHHVLIALGMKELAEKIQHVKFNDSSTMPEKLGQSYKPHNIVDECEKRMHTSLAAEPDKVQVFGDPESGSMILGVSALIVQELAAQPTAAHNFDTDAITALKAGTGADLQYWHAKLCLLLEGYTERPALTTDDYEPLAEDDTADLLRILIQFPEVVHSAYSSLKPAGIVTYLTSVTEQLKNCFSDEEDEDGDDSGATTGNTEQDVAVEATTDIPELTPGQVMLFESARIVLHNGLRVMGIKPFNKQDHFRDRADTPLASN